MAIRLNGLRQSVIEDTDVTFTPVYSDLHLDLKTFSTSYNQLYRKMEKKDLVLDYNAEAIKNSLYNIFNTLPGQKLLEPEFGLDIRQFLFYPVDEYYAQFIGETILVNLRLWEPRITVTNVNVYPDEENQQYIVDVYYNIPLFGDENDNKTFKFNTTFTRI